MPKIFKLLDGCWRCINDPAITRLDHYLYAFGFDIPESIDYCLAQNDEFRLKFRRLGGKITVYIHFLN